MGYRAYLQVYLQEDRIQKDEKRYYDAYLNSDYSIEEQKKLIGLAKEVKHVWNDHFEVFVNEMPGCKHVESNGKDYYAPCSSFSQEEDLQYARKNTAPDAFLVLFSKDEYKDTFENKGRTYHCNRFYTSIDKALQRLSKQKELNTEMNFMREMLHFVPSDSLLELDLSEIIENTEMFEPIKIENIFARMEALG